MYQLCRQAASDVKEKKIDIIDSKNISAGQGLLVLRILDALERGKSHDEILPLAEEWRTKCRLLVDIKTLKYMVRSGRVSRLKGFMARMLNLKPIISLDKKGKAVAYGKSFNRHQNMKKIINTFKDLSQKNTIWKYAIVHAENVDRARVYSEKIESILGQKPAYIMDVSPAIGVHNGIGVVGLAVMLE
jgi:DegV family protein with EDD domain